MAIWNDKCVAVTVGITEKAIVVLQPADSIIGGVRYRKAIRYSNK